MNDHADGAATARQAIRTPRAAAVAGIAFSVLLTVTFVLVRWAFQDQPDGPGQLVADGDRRDALRLALHLLPFAGIAFLWFIGVLRDRIGAHEDRFFATVFLGSGLLFVAMLFTCGAVAAGLVSTFGEASIPASPELWSFGRHVTLGLLTVYALRMAAVFTISATTIAARLGLAPRWLVVLGMVTGSVLLLTAGIVPWLEVIFPLWVFVFSVHILITTFRSPPGGDAEVVALPGPPPPPNTTSAVERA